MTAEEFFRLTPRQFHLLIDQNRERTEHQELLTGIIASAVANWSMCAPKRALAPAHFMPSRQHQQEKPKRINRKRIAMNVRAFLEAHVKR